MLLTVGQWVSKKWLEHPISLFFNILHLCSKKVLKICDRQVGRRQPILNVTFQQD